MQAKELFINLVNNTEKSSTELFTEFIDIMMKILDGVQSKEEFDGVLKDSINVLNNKRKELPIFRILGLELLEIYNLTINYDLNGQKQTVKNFLQSKAIVNVKTVSRAVKFFQNQTKLTKIITLSYSKLLKQTLEQLQLEKVVICESRPLEEGVRLASDLNNADKIKEIILITDFKGITVVLEDIDAVILGMDAWFPDNSISNKVGSLALALAAKFAHKPVYIIGNELKKVSITVKDFKQINHDEDRKKLFPSLSKDILFLNHYFDIVPADLITKIIS